MNHQVIMLYFNTIGYLRDGVFKLPQPDSISFSLSNLNLVIPAYPRKEGNPWRIFVLVAKCCHRVNGPLLTYLEFPHFYFHFVGRYPRNFGHKMILTLFKSDVVTRTNPTAITRQFARQLWLQECVIGCQSIFNCIRTLCFHKLVPSSLHIGNNSRGIYGLDIVINQGSETYDEPSRNSIIWHHGLFCHII